MKRILFFTTASEPKTMEQIRILTASFSSWKKTELEVLIYSEDVHFSLAENYGFKIEPNFQKDIFGLPIVRSLFTETVKNYDRDFYVYLNSDIVIDSNLVDIIQNINFSEFMVIGRRMNVFGVPKLDFLNMNKSEIDKELSGYKKFMHPVVGIDYFGFTKNFWNLNKMPSFRIARMSFDLWLVGFALKQNLPVIDLSGAWMPLHIEPTSRIDPSWKGLIKNRNFIKLYQFLLNRIYFKLSNNSGDISSATHEYVNGKIQIKNLNPSPTL